MQAEPAKAWIEHRKECEEGVIRGLMADPQYIGHVATIVRESDFADPFLSAWYRLTVELFNGECFTIERVRAELRKRQFLENSSDALTFAKFCDSVVSSDLIWHASELRRLAELQAIRRLLASQAEIASYLDADPAKIAADVEAQISGVYASGRSLWETGDVAAARVYETHRAAVEDGDKSKMGICTGFIDLDEITGGYFRGQLWQIAARSYMGKTAMALSLTQHQMDRGRGVYFASYEMHNDELIERMLADRTATELSKFTRGTIEQSDLPRIKAGVDDFRGKPLLLDHQPPSSVSALKARVKLAKSQQDLAIVVVDHLGLFPGSTKTPRYQQLVEVTRDLKAMAKELEVCVVLLNQLNSDADGEEPTDKHYAESKGVLANMDVSMLLHRASKTAEELKCKITKNRKGAPGEFSLRFDGVIQRIETWFSGEEWNA